MPRTGVVDGEDRKHAVAHELEHLAAVLLDGGHLAIEHSLSIPMIAVGSAPPDIDVKPRRSENQMTQRMLSVWPRCICPRKMRSPASRPTYASSSVRRGAAQREGLGHARQSAA